MIGPQGSQSSLTTNTTEKDLEVKFDEDLKFSVHIAEIARKSKTNYGPDRAFFRDYGQSTVPDTTNQRSDQLWNMAAQCLLHFLRRM